MTEAQISLEKIVENIKKVASDLVPGAKDGVPKTRKGGKEADFDPLAVLGSLRKCIEDLARFVQKDQTNKTKQENTIREHEDEIDHLKQKNLKGNIIITSKSQYGDCLISSEEQLKLENISLAKHVIDLVKLKYNQDITEDDIASCFRLKKGGILVKFWKKGRGSKFHTLSSKIKSSQGANINLYMNFMLTPRRGELFFQIRNLKRDGKITKFYSDEDGSISIKLNRGESIIRVTDIYSEGTKKLKTWTLEELMAAC